MVVRGQTGGLSEYAVRVGKQEQNLRTYRKAAEVFENLNNDIEVSLCHDKAAHLAAIHSLPEACWQPAVEAMLAGEDALPMTFVDFAELVWRRLDAGETQQAVADAIGWSRGQVSNYAALSGIADDSWSVVATTIRQCDVPRVDDGVAEVATAVAFSENLLRSILPLHADQQVELVRRNLTPDAFAYHLGRRYNRVKKTKAEAGAVGGSSKPQNGVCLPTTADKLATEYGVSKNTVQRAGKLADEYDGAAKRVESKIGNKNASADKTSLSFCDNDKSPEPKHNTQAEIAKAANTSTGMVGMAEVRRWNT